MKNLILICLLFTSCAASKKGKQTKAYQLVAKPASMTASCTDYVILNAKEKLVDLPANVQKAMSCPTILDLSDNNVLTFMDGDLVKLYFLDTKKEKTLFKYYDDIDGISGPAWSDDKSMIMFVLINQRKKHDFYAITRILPFHLSNDGTILKDWEIDKPVQFVCGGVCSAEPYNDFMFEGNTTIKYRRNLNMNDFKDEYFKIELKR